MSHKVLTQSLLFYYQKTLRCFKEVAAFLKDFGKEFIKELRKKFGKKNPWLRWIGSVISGLIAFITTLRATLKIEPFLLPLITVLSTVPLFQYFLPNIMRPMILWPGIIAIAGFVAYRTYADDIERKNLDKQIRDDAKEILVLKEKLASLEQKLTTQGCTISTLVKTRSETKQFSLPECKAKKPKPSRQNNRSALRAH